MKQKFDQIVADFDSHLQSSQREYYSDFYVGITNDVERRLFGEHNVQREKNWWIFREALDKVTAQKVEEYYLDKGMQGDTGGGNDDTVFVYCYEIDNNTIE